MVVRSTLSHATRLAQLTLSRASVREFDDKHLMQEIKAADVFHSETPTNFEHWQPGPTTGVHLKQEQTGQTANKQSGNDEQGDWNHNQPTGKSAEALMLYLGSRSHPVALVDDRRVRPYRRRGHDSGILRAGVLLQHRDELYSRRPMAVLDHPSLG